MINEKQIDYLLTVAEERNITKAARKLYISQPALSRYLLQLEEELGTPIFRREPNNLQLTSAGKIYLEGCKQVQSIYHSIRNQLAYPNQIEKKQIRIGVTTLTGEFLIPHLINQFDEKYPQIELYFVEERMADLYDKVKTNEVDIALVYHNEKNTLEYTKIMENQVFLQVPPKFVQERQALGEKWTTGTDNPPIAIQLLQDQPVILLKQGRGMRKVADSLFTLYNIEPSQIMETTSIHFCSQLTDMDKGFTLVPSMALHRFNQVKLQSYFCQLKEHSISRPIYCCYKKYQYLTAAEKFIINFMSQIESEIQIKE